MLTKNITFSSDHLGAFSSGLCLIHCLATPFIFIAQSCSSTSSCCANAPIAWSMMDFIFIGISFFAVWWSVKTTSKSWMKYALWIAWIASFILIVNGKFAFLHQPDMVFYTPALILIGLHLYNNKYCKCDDDKCCVHNC